MPNLVIFFFLDYFFNHYYAISECAAKKHKEAVRARKLIERQGQGVSINQHHQNISGVIVPSPISGQAFAVTESRGPQIIQKSSLPTTDISSGRVLAPIVELNDQAIDATVVYASKLESTPLKVNRNQTQMNQTMSASGAKPKPKLRLSQSGILYALYTVREPVVDYQETRGVSRNEDITFLVLVTSLCTQAYTAAITILVMLWNLMPLVDGIVYFVRFLLDKLIDIVQTEDNRDKAIKAAILLGELTIITFIIFLIVGLIFMPVYVLMARLFSKIFSMIAW